MWMKRGLFHLVYIVSLGSRNILFINMLKHIVIILLFRLRVSFGGAGRLSWIKGTSGANMIQWLTLKLFFGLCFWTAAK